ncbi:MAG: PadR family transcriptional regulator [Acidobacteria bacterium]|nr:PadR family transcriptional regulator [Acidobacteriota bacterium]MCA1648786.1 PadR family transcriptional regulator [Acidobacteriota bacterium]
MSLLRRPTLDERARRVLPLTPAVLQILLSLASDDRHGLGIAADVKEFTDGRSVLGPGTLYGTIKRMLDAELILDLGSPAAKDDDPRRRYYRITELGRRALVLEMEGLESILGTAQRRQALKRT